MHKLALLILLSIASSGQAQGDTIVKWLQGHQLSYADFLGKPGENPYSNVQRDTLGLLDCSIKYDLKTEGGKLKVKAYAIANLKKSWIVVNDPDVLKHEQGHFDITEIFARRFERMVNDTTITDAHSYFGFLTQSYNLIIEELIKEQAKYDAWTMNAPGKEYYFKWINEQLAIPKETTSGN